MKLYRGLVGISFVFFLLTNCTPLSVPSPTAHQGLISLSDHDYTKAEPVKLDGEWIFIPASNNENASQKTVFAKVPGEWSSFKNQSTFGVGTYSLRIILPKKRPPLSLEVDGISTAYTISINDSIVGGVGTLAKDPTQTKPNYQHRIFPLPSTDSIVNLSITVANFHHYKGGILHSIVLDATDRIVKRTKDSSISGGILLGICLVNLLFYIILFVFLPDSKYFLAYALLSLLIFIHVLCLLDRKMYLWMGEDGWFIAYKIELITIFLGVGAKLMFYDNYFKGLINQKALMTFYVLLGLQILYTLIFPAPWFSYIDIIIPFNFLAVLVFVMVLFIRANKQDREGSTTIALLNVFLLVMLVNENLILNRHVHNIQLTHYAVIIYSTGISLVLLRRIVLAFKNEKVLTQGVKLHADKLEKQNRNLEEIVNRRTAQLIEAEKESYKLQLEKKERDLDSLAANNLVKQQFTQNLITELEGLPHSEKEWKSALNQLIQKLKSQSSLDEKLDVLQQNLDRVNAEFYDRLQARFPDLSKTERELCAYIKLNLSTKDIAELRKTSLNTINVTRSRLRKKLNLTRDEELEGFLRQF